MSLDNLREGFFTNDGDLSVYKPNFVYRRLSDITLDDISSWNVKAIGLDIDHTICYDCTPVFIAHAGRWLKTMQKKGIRFVIITNAIGDRAVLLSLFLKIPYVALAHKPEPDGYIKAAAKVGCKVGEMAFVGDRLFNDVCGANNVGAVSVYVQPPARDFLYFRHRKKREREKALLNLFEKH